MMRQAARAVLAGLLLSALAGPTAAADAVLRGIVRDGAGVGIAGVRVQVFLDGFPLASARADSVGAYRVVFPWNATADSTVVAWWTAEGSELVPALAVLRESAAALRLGTWNAAIPRVAAPAESVHDAVLRTRAVAGRRDADPDSTGPAPGTETGPAR